ncbi:unnamed protein product [Diamesa hyperborea]
MGKSSSKLKQRRSQSVAWSFRFATFGRKMVISNQPHLEIKDWLIRLELPEYEEQLKQYNGVEDIINLSESEIKELGIKNSAHRARMVSSLVALKESFAIKTRSGSFRRKNRFSLAVTPTTKETVDENGSTYELLTVNSTKQSKSLGDLLEMESPSPDTPTSSSSSSSQDVVALKKALDWELSLDSRDLRSHAWYHGPIPRQRADEIVQNEGDFLVRDCVSQPGNFVLSCKTKTQILHFVINKLLIQPETVYERVQFQFEDEPFDTVPDLITFYVGSDKAISIASGARIQTPCNRIYPLSFYATKYGVPYSGSSNSIGSGINSPSPIPGSGAFRFNPYTQQNTYRSPMSSPPRTKRDIPPRLPSKKQRSQSLTPQQAGQTQSQRLANPENTQSLSRVQMGGSSRQLHSRTPSLNRETSESLSPCIEQKNPGENDETDQAPSPPPKPNRNLSQSNQKDDQLGPVQRVASYHASGSDSGNGSGDSAQSSATGEEIQQHRGVIIKNPRFIPNSVSSVTLKSFADIDPVAAEEALLAMAIPVIEQICKFDLENFHTVLLPFNDYRPLDSGTLNTFRMMIGETSPRVIANHMTRIDIRLILEEAKKDRNPLDCTGIELMMLEQGKQLRKDLIERTQCLKLLVAVTILTCPSDAERAETLNKWIQIAIDAKTALGNLFGFCAIMLGLCMPQIQKLETTWHTLRQKYTDSAFNFEAKLRPTLKSMNDCSNPQAPNTTVPHILPYVLLRDRTIDDILDLNIKHSSLVQTCLTPFETNTQDFGFSIMFAHLDSARSYNSNMTLYNRNAKIVMNDNSRLDPLLEEAFRTEFHIKFLWGSRGAFVAAEERHSKFEQVLGMMADKFANHNSVATGNN